MYYIIGIIGTSKLKLGESECTECKSAIRRHVHCLLHFEKVADFDMSHLSSLAFSNIHMFNPVPYHQNTQGEKNHEFIKKTVRKSSLKSVNCIYIEADILMKIFSFKSR